MKPQDKTSTDTPIGGMVRGMIRQNKRPPQKKKAPQPTNREQDFVRG